MIELFKKNDITNALILIPYVVVIRLYSLINPVGYEIKSHDGFLIEQIYLHLVSGPVAQSVVGIVLIYIQANLLNLLVNRSRLLSQQSALPGLFYILSTGFIPEFQVCSPVIIGMTFFILAVFNVFQIYKKNVATGSIFNAALLVSLASLFYFPFLILSIPVFIEITILKSFKMKERIQFITGLVVLYWILASALFYFGKLSSLPYGTIGLGGSSFFFRHVSGAAWILLAVVALLIFWGLLNYYNYMKKKGIGVRKKIDFFYWYLAGTFLAFLVLNQLDVQFLLILCFPFALFLGMTFLNLRSGALAEMLHILFLAALFYLHFGDFLAGSF